jgi:hypothetical protein
MALIVEPRHLALPDQRAARLPKGSELRPVVGEAGADLGVGAPAPAEEILASRRAQAFRDAGPRLRLGSSALRHQVCKLLCELHPIILHISAGLHVHPAQLTLSFPPEAAEMFAKAEPRGLGIDKPQMRLVVHWTR